MRVTERLISQNKRERQQKARKQVDEPEQLDLLKEWKATRGSFLNRRESVFASRMEEGLNSRKSIFDSQAVFHATTGSGRQ